MSCLHALKKGRGTLNTSGNRQFKYRIVIELFPTTPLPTTHIVSLRLESSDPLSLIVHTSWVITLTPQRQLFICDFSHASRMLKITRVLSSIKI